MHAQVSGQHDRLTSVEFLAQWLEERGLRADAGVLEPITGFGAPQFQLVTHDRAGNPRRDVSHRRIHGEKYRAPPNSGVNVYAAKPDSWSRFSAAKEKWIAEGHGKVLALEQLGLPVLGINGCEMWHPSGNALRLLPDIEDAIRRGDTVNLVMDGDFRDPSKRVGWNAQQILFHLRAIGASARLLNLKRDEKLDDLLAARQREGRDARAELAAIGFLDDVPSPIALTVDADILQRPAPEWIVKGLVPPGELTAIVGETSCGKTFLTMDLLLAVARREPYWFGQRIKRHGLVVHITLEGTSLGNRRRAYQKHHKLKDSLPYMAIESPINLRDPEVTDNVTRSIRDARNRTGLDVVLIAVDTVNRALGGGDENSSEDMGAFLAAAERIKAAFPQSGILLVHHLGKDPSKGARGHSSFSANVGAELQVDHDERTGIRTVKVRKQRDGRTDLKFNFKLTGVELGEDEDGEAVTSCVVEVCTPPDSLSKRSERDIYQWIHSWWLREWRSRAISERTVRDNVVRIVPSGTTPRVTVEDVKSAFKWAINTGLCELAEQDGRGATYILKPPPEKKY